MQTQKLKEQNLSGDEFSKKISKMEMPHEIQCELIMTEQAAKELYNFLGKELKNYEERKKTPKKKHPKKNISSKAI